MNGDYFLGAVLATCLTKLVLRYTSPSSPVDAQKKNAIRAEAMFMMTSVVRVGQSEFVTIPMDEDASDRVLTCLRVLAHQNSAPVSQHVTKIFTVHCREVYSRMVQDHEVCPLQTN
jgi:coatomer subunit beta